MHDSLPAVYIARHGETDWSASGRHTGRTDLPLSERGERNAARLGQRLEGLSFAAVFTSPLQRAQRTCELAGHGATARIDPDLREWDYGQYEGLRTAEIRRQHPQWQLFRDGCPGGESLADVATRANRVLSRLHQIDGDALVFSSGHILRILTALWLGLEPSSGRLFILGTAALSILGYEHSRAEPALLLWNDDRHLAD